MLLLLSSPEKGENPVIAAGKRQWPLNNVLFEIKKSYRGCWKGGKKRMFHQKLTKHTRLNLLHKRLNLHY